jgi:hypothetical protein
MFRRVPRGTAGEPISSIRAVRLPTNGEHTARFGVTNFHAITVTPTKQRALHICHKPQKNGRAFKRFWFPDPDEVSPLATSPEFSKRYSSPLRSLRRERSTVS